MTYQEQGYFTRDRLHGIIGQLTRVRDALVRSAIALGISTILSFVFARQVFHFFTSRAGGMTFIYTELTGMVSTYMKVCFYSGVVLAMPYFIFELLRLVRPLIPPGKKRYLYVVAPVMLAIFAVGVTYTYYIFLPPAFSILFGTQWVPGVVPRLNIASYMSFVASSLLWIGLLFEIPVAMYFLARFGLVSHTMLLKKWRWAVLGSVFVAAVLTPTGNPFHQGWYDILVMDTGFVVSVPVLMLYFGSVILAKVALDQRQKSAGQTSAAPA